jgi:hypothetical protein
MGVMMRCRYARLVGVLFAVLELSSVLLGQNTAQLHGQVVDEQGALVSGRPGYAHRRCRQETQRSSQC